MTRAALYLVIAATGNLVWEAVQIPLYTIWSTGTTREIFVAVGVAYTIFSEWLNVQVWNYWSYSAIMPVLPWFGTGLAPVLQWAIVPGLAFAISGMRKGNAA